MLTAEFVKTILRYVPSTGKFYWLTPRLGIRAGDEAGCVTAKGYVMIGIKGEIYRAHRLAWLYMTGEWPVAQIDHRNTVKHDNRWRNLRPATNRFNQENQRTAPKSNKSSGLLGVSWAEASACWKAQIKVSGKSHWLGHFEDKHEAHRAYVKAKRSLHAGCTI